MGGLSKLTVPTRTVETSGGELTVRGISVNDIAFLMQFHAGDLNEAFGAAMEEARTRGGGGLKPEDMGRILQKVASTVPVLLAGVIAVACDEYDLLDEATRMPMPDQVRVLTAIFELTFRSDADLKNVVETVLRIVTGAQGLRVVSADPTL